MSNYIDATVCSPLLSCVRFGEIRFVDHFAIVQWGPGVQPSPLLLGTDLVWAKGTLIRQAEVVYAMHEVFGPERAERGELRTYAWLILEPENPHDANAVAVYIGQRHVGYIPRELAAEVSPQLRQLRHVRWFNGQPVGPASCVAVLRRTADGTRLVGCVGPWPPLQSQIVAQRKVEAEQDAQRQKEAGEEHRRRSGALDAVKKGMTREQLIAALGTRPGKEEEKATKRAMRHTLHFFEDYEKPGKYELKVVLEDGAVVEWSGTRP